MMRFTLKKKSKIQRGTLYSISTDIENFSKIMPKHFKSLKIKSIVGNNVLVDEKIYFLDVKVKHVILHPEIHEVHILSGIMSGTTFIESYKKTENGTDITIDVSVNLNGISKLLYPFGFILKRQMSKVMEEFLESSEKFASDSKKKIN